MKRDEATQQDRSDDRATTNKVDLIDLDKVDLVVALSRSRLPRNPFLSRRDRPELVYGFELAKWNMPIRNVQGAEGRAPAGLRTGHGYYNISAGNRGRLA